MPFQPICVLCFNDCDRGGSFSSCRHYFCSRCTARLPTAAPCPVCRQLYQLIQLNHPNIQPVLQDGATALAAAEQVIVAQMRHYTDVVALMRRALAQVQAQYAEMHKQRQTEQGECAAAVSRAQALETELGRLREELARASAASAAAARVPPAHVLSHSPAQQSHLTFLQMQPSMVAQMGGGVVAAHPDSGCGHNPVATTAEGWQTPSTQLLALPSTVRHAPHGSPHAAHWQCTAPASMQSSPSASTARGEPQHHHSSRGHDGGGAPALSPAAAPPLGWSASSVISKRHRSDAAALQSQWRIEAPVASAAGAPPPPPPALTVHPHTAPPPSHPASLASTRAPSSSGGLSVSGSGDWCNSRAAAARQPPQSLVGGTHYHHSHAAGTATRPLCRLFGSPRGG
ncbi:hypothetical protein NESM_000736400 [Novymonas esmeraldas]|uniref:RING-type domain-containing protein n=1 Tax=Novymonas esmeraldas TaxID=1808958 RepID=A0AAW0EXG0_9TRYP